MVFNSLTFLVFFAIVLAIHNLPLPWGAKKINLVVASFIFYAAWNPPFVLLLMFSAFADYYLAKGMGRTQQQKYRRAFLIVSLVLNLGVLATFKYANFLQATFADAVRVIGVHYRPPAFSIILPLGISFYTFETISYLIDIYRRRIEPARSFVDYSLFLSFFPHLVAGPIVRAGDFLPQCQIPHRATAAQMGWGASLFVFGLFEKTVLADTLLAPVADRVYEAVQSAHAATFADCWTGTLAFAGQIFFDFAGYSMCGIGAALCLGFVLNDNFRFPYAAVGFSDFWQRWHISLSSWLRDYLYIPLGGNRHGSAQTYRNLMITMFLGGLWHGASWRFVAWGMLHGCYLAVERAVKAVIGDVAWIRSSRLIEAVLALMTFGLVCVTWVFFRATSFEAAFHMLSVMAVPSSRHHVVHKTDVLTVLIVMSALLMAHWCLRNSTLEHFVARVPWPVRACGIAGLIVLLLMMPGDDRAFIYFQF